VPQALQQSLSPADSANMRTAGRSHTPPARTTASLPPPSGTPSTPHKNLFSYAGQPTPSRTPSSRHGVLNLNARSDLYSLSPIKYSSQRMLLSPQRQARAVSKVPYKVLDAPDLADDFYLNLVDWGSQGTLGVGLGSCVYMWNSSSGRVTKLCELADDSVTSVNWIQRVSHPAPFSFRILTYAGLTPRRWNKSGSSPDLGCADSASPAYHDGPHSSRWRTCVERAHSHIRVTGSYHLPPGCPAA
jgi:cell division cycle 20-like protein 1 (cofactor of APC complex)